MSGNRLVELSSSGHNLFVQEVVDQLLSCLVLSCLVSSMGPLLLSLGSSQEEQEQASKHACRRRATNTVQHSAYVAARCGMDQFGSAIVIVLQQSRNSQVSARRGKAGTICWWRRRESWEWIGPTVGGL